MTFKDILKMTMNLMVLYIAGGVLIAAVYATSSPIIFLNKKIEKEKALKKMIPEADKVPEKLGDWHPHEKHAEYFKAHKGDELIGYIVQTFGKGYSSYINILFSVDNDFIVKKIHILGHAETPGLGDEIELDYFKNQFVGKDMDHLKVVKAETKEYIQAITGATISTRAVSEDGIRNGLKFLKETLKEGVKHEPSAAKH